MKEAASPLTQKQAHVLATLKAMSDHRGIVSASALEINHMTGFVAAYSMRNLVGKGYLQPLSNGVVDGRSTLRYRIHADGDGPRGLHRPVGRRAVAMQREKLQANAVRLARIHGTTLQYELDRQAREAGHRSWAAMGDAGDVTPPTGNKDKRDG